MSNKKISIKIKKFWYSPIAGDGGIGVNWVELQLGQREATVQFNGSAADKSQYKNVIGNVLAESLSKGTKTMNFQFADLDPDILSVFCGGTVTTTADAESYDAPENENQIVQLSFMFLTENNVLFRIPRAQVDCYPIVNDDDLHYYNVESTLLLPEKAGVSMYGFDLLKTPDSNDILTFSFGSIDSAPATINTTNHTVAITITESSAAALTPSITISKGASITPNSGVTKDFSSPATYTVESANGGTQTWTVTVTTTP